jgi:hypothetical protein
MIDADCMYAIESFQWSHPETTGDIPPPMRAHTATLIDRKIVVYGGGYNSQYYSDTFVLDTLTRRWTRATFPSSAVLPPSRRAHTAEYYRGRLWIFGGGNGSEAVNDVWTLEVGVVPHPEKMRWERVAVQEGPRPGPRGYHTAHIIGSTMVIVGGSDGKECFNDVWCLDLGEWAWLC